MNVKKMLILVAMVALVSVPSFAALNLYAENFDGPTHDWTANPDGAFNGDGTFNLDTSDHLYRNAGSGGDWSMNLDAVNVDLSTALVGQYNFFKYEMHDILASDGSDKWFTVFLQNSNFSDDIQRMHLVVNTYAGNVYSGFVTVGGVLNDFDIQVDYNEALGEITVLRSINGGSMDAVVTAGGFGVSSAWWEHIFVQNQGNPAGEPSVDLDSYSFVPEPATMALLGLGGLVLRKRR